MSLYTHVLVSKLQGKVELNERLSEETKFLDDVPVNDYLYQFGSNLRKHRAFRNIRFGTEEHQYHARNNVYVYMPGQVYTIGNIGYADYNISEGSTIRYSYRVTSPHVKNYKYRAGSSARTWALSTNLDRAIRNAKTYLRPYSVADIAGITCDGMAQAMGSAKSEYSTTVWRAFHDIEEDLERRESSVLFSELRHLLETGHEFINDGVEKLIKTAADALDIRSTVATTQTNIALVFAVPSAIHNAPPEVTVIRGGKLSLDDNIRHNVYTIFNNEGHVRGNTEKYPLNELPEELHGKVSVLNMVDNGKFVEGVGYRINEQVMYVLYE
jgi:hypothetical protein